MSLDWIRRHRRGILWGAAGALLVALVAPTVVLHTATAAHRHAPDAVPARPVAIVLGAGLTPDGTPTRVLAARLDVAVALYTAEKVDAVLVSGDNSRDDYDEVGGMRDYLVAAGVPGRKIAADHAGFSTWDSCARAHRVFGVRAATVVTQDFHLPRAVGLCRAAGIDAKGVGDERADVHPVNVAYGYARELPAAATALFDAVIRPDPRFLGPREPGVGDALSAPRA